MVGRSAGVRRSFDLGRVVVTYGRDAAGRISANVGGVPNGTNTAGSTLPPSATPSARYTPATSTGDPLAETVTPSLAADQESNLPDTGTPSGAVAPNGMLAPETTTGTLANIPNITHQMAETASREVEGVEQTPQSTSRTSATPSAGGGVAGPQTSGPGTSTSIGGNGGYSQSGGNSGSGGSFGNSLGTSAGTATGATSASSSIDRAQVISQVTQHLETMRLSNGNGEMRIQLNPEHLGNVQVSVATHQDGVVARIAVESAQIQQVMDGAREHLRSTLEARGVRVNSVEVTVTQNPVGSDSGSNAAFAGQRQWQASADQAEFTSGSTRRAASVAGAQSAGVGAVASTAVRNATGSGGATRLDYRV